jgi:hypothetical protein
MSNHLAVAAVTATLVQVLREAVQQDVTGAEVRAARPEGGNGEDNAPEVRVFLYRVEPNAAWRNADLPTRNGRGDLTQRPQAALTLNYLLAFAGSEAQLEPQRLLGSAVRRLHARPLLSRDDILQMVQAAVSDDPNHPLAAADLADQPELVRFTPLNLDLEALSSLWSVFFQSPYRLSVAYEASVVLLSPDETARPSFPVQERRLFVTSILRPRIRRVVAATDGEVIGSGDSVRIEGSQLRGEITAVWFGGTAVEPPDDAVGEERIEVEVPAEARAGVLGLRVEHRRLMGEPPRQRSAGTSNNVAIVLRPRIRLVDGSYAVQVSDVTVDAEGLRAGVVELTVDPAVGRRQQVIVHLNQVGAAPDATPRAFSFGDESRDREGEPDATNDLSVPFAAVPAGTYLVRVQVDGAESALERETAGPDQGLFVRPQVVVP